MYLRTTTSRPRQDGSRVRYLQLAHNEWDTATGQAKAKVLYNFGREDRLDRDAIARLIGSLSRVLEPGQALAAAAPAALAFVDSRPMGGAYVLDGLWRRLGIDATLGRLLGGRRLDQRAERVLFALVANRALEPCSKLAATRWVAERAAVPGLDSIDEDVCCRAMDWLLEVEAELAEQVYWATADLLNLEVDLLFFDTTSTYFETEQADPPVEDDAATMGLRAYGKSKDHRPDLPQVVIGMAVTRDGIPIRVWTWPGNTGDSTLIRQVKDDLRAWKLSRVVWVADRGLSSAANRRYLQRAGGHYIIGEKLRGDSDEAAAALARQGRYRTVADNLQVKEVVIDDATMRDRFVICRNPDQADRDRTVREQLLARLAGAIGGSDRLTPDERAALAGKLRTKASYNKFLRTTKAGLLRIDRGAVAAEAKLDGKFLLRTSDPTLTAEDVALGYKQTAGSRARLARHEVHPGPTARLPPPRSPLRAHVVLCWLALLLIRLAEHATGDTWRNLRHELDRLHLGTFTGPTGTMRQRTELTSRQRDILRALDLPQPARFTHLAAA